MTHYIIAMKDGWKPGDCYMCQFKCEAKYGINPACPLANAREAVEVDVPEGHQFSAIFERKDGSKDQDWTAVKLYAVEEGK